MSQKYQIGEELEVLGKKAVIAKIEMSPDMSEVKYYACAPTLEEALTDGPMRLIVFSQKVDNWELLAENAELFLSNLSKKAKG